MSEMSESNSPSLADTASRNGDALSNEALRLRSVEQLALIRVLAVAHEHRLDVAAAVRALAEDSPPGRKQPLTQLVGCLNVDMPLIDALEQTRGVLDRSTVVALRLASETGTLPSMYRALIRSSDAPTSAALVGLASPGRHFFGAAIGLLVLTLLLSFQAQFIWPIFEELYREMLPAGLEAMPPSAVFLIENAPWWPLLALGGLAAIAALIAVQVVSGRLNLWRPWASTAEALAGSARRRGTVDLRALLAIVIGSGRPLTAGLSTLARFHHAPATRQRLLAVCEATDQGADPWQALADHRLLDARESRALAAASSDEARTWMLRWMATSRRDRWQSIAHSFEQMLSLGLIFAYGAAVALAAIAMFQMLSQLIQVLS